MHPTVTGNLIFSPVLPSHKSTLPDSGKPASLSSLITSATFAPSNTGVL